MEKKYVEMFNDEGAWKLKFEDTVASKFDTLRPTRSCIALFHLLSSLQSCSLIFLFTSSILIFFG